MRFNRSIELGERFQVRVRQINPRQDMIRFEEVSPEPYEASQESHEEDEVADIREEE